MINPPKVLYHYTAQRGLLGILESNALWATKIHYLNDSLEFQLALNLARSVLQRRLKGERSTKKRTKVQCLLKNLRSIASMNICVCSFSEHRDLLSQWRAYAPEAPGFCIGVHTGYVEQLAAAQNFSLEQCIYDERQQCDRIEETVHLSLEQDFNTTPARIDPERPRTLVALPTGGDFAERIARVAPLIKSSAFREETEWRLISIKGIDNRKLSFREGRSMLRPYTPFCLGDRNEYLQSLTVGPTPHPQLAEGAVRNLLARWGVDSCEVNSSTIPYRTW